MLPVNFFDRSLISDAIRERQRSVRSHRRRGHTSLGSPAAAGLRQREWDRANRQQQKQVKGASKNLRFDRRVNLFFHFFGPSRVVPVESVFRSLLPFTILLQHFRVRLRESFIDGSGS
jgi:hypothetical protein